MSFDKIVTMTKRNHIYFGPTESYKVATTLEEISVDINNIYSQFNSQEDEIWTMASGYLDPSGSLRDLGSQISEIENTFNRMIYIQATQEAVL